MSWTPLKDRIDKLPLILAGPILRRVEPESVTVWMALKEARKVTLQVFRTRASEGRASELDSTLLLTNSSPSPTMKLGEYLHVVAVTAKATSAVKLQPGELYVYNLGFGNGDWLLPPTSGVLNTEFTDVSISYFESEHGGPTFAMPPEDLNHLRLIHGSCRKPHDPGLDALAILDDLIDKDKQSPLTRPHQLFLTGDQIYAEEVMDPLLWLIMDAADALMGWDEKLPGVGKNASELKPGSRLNAMKKHSGISAHGKGQLKSHLLSLGEYYAMHLLAWSEVLWPTDLPSVADLVSYFEQKETAAGGKLPDAERKFVNRLSLRSESKKWAEETTKLKDFFSDLWKVRRALPNIPTYMIFDDHDVTDDWFINRWWCINVLTAPLGKHLVQNALVAYALFQAWGNTPEQFASGSGQKLLEAVTKWTPTGISKTDREEIDRYIGLPFPGGGGGLARTRTDGDVLVLDRDDAQALKWHYVVDGPKHEVIVLDTRTWRGYPKEPLKSGDPAALLSPTAFDEQLAKPLQRMRDPKVEATLVIAPTNPVGIRALDWLQLGSVEVDRRFQTEHAIGSFDVGDAWNFHDAAFATLLATLFKEREHVVLLSGDIHFGYALRLSYWARRPFGTAPVDPASPEKSHVLAQLTSSAFKNADALGGRVTKALHTKAKELILPEKQQYWAGWNDWPSLLIRKVKVAWYRQPLPNETPVVLLIDYENFAVTDQRYQPDWRYRIQFAPRSPCSQQPSSCTRWFQEGREIVGLHNIGVVTFEWPEDPSKGKAVIQNLYWWPPGSPAAYCCSTYRVTLELDVAPPDLQVRTAP